MTTMVGVGAINTGNNLLYLLLGMMFGLIIVSGILSERVLKEVTLKRLEAGDLYANTINRVRFEITNQKRLGASYSLSVQEHESRPTRAKRRRALGLPEQVPRRRKQRERENDPGGPKALALRIPAGQKQVATAEYVFPQRGLYQYVGLDLITRFPFGFFEKIKPFREAHEVLVYPAIRTDIGTIVADDAREGEVEQQVEGRDGEFFGLREFRDGDDMRDVHWKASARRGVLVRRLYDRRDNESIAVHLFNWVPPGDTSASQRAVDELEHAISVTASICAELTQRGHRYSLHTIDETVSEGSGAGQLQSALRALALLSIRRDNAAPTLQLSRAKNRLLVETTTLPAEVASQIRSRMPLPARSEAA